MVTKMKNIAAEFLEQQFKHNTEILGLEFATINNSTTFYHVTFI